MECDRSIADTRDDAADLAMLVRTSQNGDPVALRGLIETHRPLITAFCAHYHRDYHDRQELVQLVMIRIWKGIGGFDSRSSFSTWLYQIVRNTAITEYQRRGRLPAPVDVHSGEDPFPTADAHPSVEDVVVARDELRRALDTVRDPYRTIVTLVDVWGYAHPEVADMYGLAEPTVRTRLWRGRRAMRAALTCAAA